MKRFFTKKSVAIILSAILVVGLLPLRITHAYPGEDAINALASVFSEGVPGIITMFLNNVILPIFALWIGIAGLILDYSIEFSIYSNGFDQMKTSIQAVWVLIRDTANILFIFILLYAAIKQIVFGEAAKKVLTTVIISAVLINFSMFFTRVAIDASNMISTALYNQIEIPLGQEEIKNEEIKSLNKQISDLFSYKRKIGLSGRIMDGLKVNNLSNTVATLNLGITTTILLGALNIVLYVILLWVFIMLAVMIMGRFVTLVILLATSPIGFIGGAIPYLGEVSKKWQKSLLDQCLMVPALFFFLLLTLKLAVNLKTDGSLMTNLFNFFLVAFLLFKTVSVTKGFSGEIGKLADKAAGAVAGLAVASATGGAALIGRQTVGRLATNVSNKYSSTLEALGAKGGAMGTLANVANTSIKGTAKSTFDIRGTTAFKKVAEQAGESGMKIDKSHLEAGGKYGKGTGYIGQKDERKKEVEEQAKKYAESAEKTAKEDKEKIEKYNKQISELEAKISLETDPNKKNTLGDQLKTIKDEKDKNTSAGINEEIKKAVSALSQSRLGGKDIVKEIENKEKELSDIQHVDFAADPVIAKFEKDKKKKKNEIEAKKSELSKAAGTIQKAKIQAEIDSLEDDVDIIDKNIKPEKERVNNQAAIDKKKIEKELGDLKTLSDSLYTEATKDVEKLMSHIGSEEQKFLLARKNMKQDWANNQRDGILNMLKLMTTTEREGLAKAAEKVNYNADKAKEEAVQKKMMKDLQEQWKKDNPS